MDNEKKLARETLERYTGSPISDFQNFIMLTNFSKYLDLFAEVREIPVIKGGMFAVAHDPSLKITMIDIKLGSPSAALAIDLLSGIEIEACVFLGMCGGLRSHYLVGDYLIPLAAIRAEATSDFYFEKDVPALGNFTVEKAISEALEARKLDYHKGIVHTTNKRLWEFNAAFKEKLKKSGVQGIEMECATLFSASYFYKIPLGALLLVSDLPLQEKGIKTKKSSAFLYEELVPEHIQLGIETVQAIEKLLSKKKTEFSRKELFY